MPQVLPIRPRWTGKRAEDYRSPCLIRFSGCGLEVRRRSHEAKILVQPSKCLSLRRASDKLGQGVFNAQNLIKKAGG